MAKKPTIQEEYDVEELLNGILSDYITPTKVDEMTVEEFRKIKNTRKKTTPPMYKDNEPAPFEELKEDVYHITLEGLPKCSTNQMYAGGAYYSRKAIKDKYKKSIHQQFNKVIRFKCVCVYEFYFKTRALDSSNCSVMAKMIEDCILPSDSYRMVGGVYYSSAKADRDYVVVHIFPPSRVEELVSTIRENVAKFFFMKIDSHNRVKL